MKKPGLILSVILGVALVLGAAAQDSSEAAKRLNSQTGSPSLEKSRQLIVAAQSLEKAGNSSGALADYTEAIKGQGLPLAEKARALFDRGLLLDEMNRLDEALGDYGAALALSPDFAAALNNRANVYRRRGRFELARRDYLASLAAGNSQSQYSYYGLGLIAEAQRRIDQARIFYQKALTADSGFALARRHLAALDQTPIHLRPPRMRPDTIADNLPAGKVTQPVVLRPPAEAKAGPLREPPPMPKPAAPPSPALKPSLAGSSRQAEVQLGAWRSERQAEAGWTRAVARAEGVLAGLAPHIVAVDLAKGRYYRLRVASQTESAQALCKALTAKGLDCIPARD